jgi:subtilisin family serine protease
MFLKISQTALLLVLMSGSAAVAAEQQTFMSQGKKREILVEVDYRVVNPGATLVATKKSVPADLLKSFSDIRLQVVPVSAVKNVNDTVGIPIWFDRTKGAVGVLTSEIVVQLDSPEAIKKIKSLPDLVNLRESQVKDGFFVARFREPMSGLESANKLYGQDGVRYAHPNFKIAKNWRSGTFGGPSDEPYFASQWHLTNRGQGGALAGADIHAKEAWDVTLGSEDVVIAVLDAGFEMTHPDLRAGWFVNHGETPGNGIDDDNNGFIDDINGWNFRSRNGDLTTGFVNDHGTAVAGLVGARVNGVGMTGVCPRCTMLPVSLSWDVADDAEAFYYVSRFGAQIITNSWGYPVGTPYTDAVVTAINEVAATGREGKGTIILFAMNNMNIDDCIGDEPDISSLDSVIAVSASSDLDKKVTFSAWGACMEFLSPSYESGRAGISTADLLGNKGYNTGNRPGDLPDLDYTNDFGGTSAATPISAGVFGLMLSLNENLTRDEALAMVLATADKVHPELAMYDPSGFSMKYGFGRINAAKALRAVEVFRKYSRKEKDARDTRVRRQ